MHPDNIPTGIFLILMASGFWWLFSTTIKSLDSPKYKADRKFWIGILIINAFIALLLTIVGVIVLFATKPALRSQSIGI